MIEKNSIYELEIEGFNHQGYGVSHLDKLTIFTKGAIKGERIKIKVIKIVPKKKIAYGKIVEIIEVSKDRVEPKCSLHRCGGCQLLHLSYKAQLEFKKGIVEDSFKHIGKLSNIKVENCIGMENPWRYRNKESIPVRRYDDKLMVGFFAPHSHEIIPFSKCFIHPQINDKIILIIKKWIQRYKIPVYNDKTYEGKIRNIIIRHGDKEIMVIVVSRSRRLPFPKKIVNELRALSNNIVSVVLNIHPDRSNRIVGDNSEILYGKKNIKASINNTNFLISPTSFYQVNSVQMEKMYETVLNFANLSKDDTVFDGYCGVGTFSLYLAPYVKKVVGVEIDNDAVEDAIKNSELNGIENCEFIQGYAEKVIPEMIKKGDNIDLLLVDPPRKGVDKIFIDAIVESNIKKMIYISCNPATLSRDLNYLVLAGYSVKKVQPIDMFPQTYHIETVVLIEKK